MNKPICYDLFCGLGGWSEAFIAEGYECIGFDIEAHEYWVPESPDGDGCKGTKPIEKRGWTQGCAISLGMEGVNNRPRTKLLKYPSTLILRDVRSIHGSELKDAAVIVASPPCQAYSYRAMPWRRAKALPPPDNTLFNGCFRIQREAIEAAGHWIPLIVENVRGAQKWVGRARWNYGSFYLWGDVPALMPHTFKGQKMNPDGTNHGQGSWFAIADSKNRGTGRKVSMNFHEHEKTGKPGRPFQSTAVEEMGVKNGNDWFGSGDNCSLQRRAGSKSNARKAASAMIAKIPEPLARHIARCYKPKPMEVCA